MTTTGSDSSPATRKLGKHAFMFVIFTVFLDMLAFGIVMPTMPNLIAELLNGPEAMAAATDAERQEMIARAVVWGGYITVVYAILNFLSQPILGNLSDRFGRRPVLLVSMATLAIDFLIMGFSHTIWLLFLGRCLTGISGATHSTANAYIADTTESHERAQAFGMIGAAFGLGFIFGPVIGGYLGKIDPRAPFFAAAGLGAINFLYGFFVLPESLAKSDRRPFDWKRANAFGAFKHFSKFPQLSWLLLALGLYGFAHWVYPSTFAYFGPIKFGWSPDMTGLALGAVGLGAAVVQAGLIRSAIKRFGATKIALFGFGIAAFAQLAYGLAPYGWMIFMLIPIGSLAGLIQPALNQILTSRVERNAQGELQGAMASIQSFGQIFAPLIFTQTLTHFSVPEAPVYFPGAAFVLASCITVIAIFPLIRGLLKTEKVSEPSGSGEIEKETADSLDAEAKATP